MGLPVRILSINVSLLWLSDCWCVSTVIPLLLTYLPIPLVGSAQDYISTHQLAEYSVRDVGWITAILVFLTLFLGVQVGPLLARKFWNHNLPYSLHEFNGRILAWYSNLQWRDPVAEPIKLGSKKCGERDGCLRGMANFKQGW
jgi:hypothetical protein